MKPDNNQPLISCLCVTHKKPDMLQRVINCFYNQSYKNKQLVIVYEDFDTPTHEFVINSKFDDNVKIIMIDSSKGKIPLGELRNISIREADGEYITQWDDDDWFDPERLLSQMEILLAENKPACVLSRWIVFNSCTNKAYLSNRRLWEGSILCRKDIILQKPYPAIPKGEDSRVVEFLHQNGDLHLIEDMPHLYVYIYHGDNTWEAAHFNQIFDFSTELSESYSMDVLEVLSEK